MMLKADESYREKANEDREIRARKMWTHIKLCPHQGIDKKMLSKPEKALHCEREKGQMKERIERTRVEAQSTN